MANNRFSEIPFLTSWHLKLAILAGILTPAVTATGAYYGVKITMVKDKAELSQRVDRLELDSTKTYADKASLQSLDSRMQKMENDITEIKTILKTKL